MTNDQQPLTSASNFPNYARRGLISEAADPATTGERASHTGVTRRWNQQVRFEMEREWAQNKMRSPFSIECRRQMEMESRDRATHCTHRFLCIILAPPHVP